MNHKRPGSWVVGVPSPQIKVTANRDAGQMIVSQDAY